jgi:cobalamin synthase
LKGTHEGISSSHFISYDPACGQAHAPDGKDLARSMAFFPLTGLVIGLLLLLSHYLFSFF